MENDNVIKGTPASPGIIKGTVSILKNKEDEMNFTEGSIAVVERSNANLVHVIGKALGVIIDEGGMMSHAAVLSRELHKPCVIGTKVATATLKNGDIVEIDGEKGTVKIIK
ncbi:MAG: PEP-utilizing enzyme [Patescibacteria group bacterium]